MAQKQFVQAGDKVLLEIPFSEVCMSMRVAGKPMYVELQATTWNSVCAQLYSLDGKPYSFPITSGEAGIYQDSDGYYCYPVNPS